jgi:hypothetical protein
LRTALGSANECEDELHTLNRRALLAESDQDLIAIARQLCAMLAKFIARVEGDIARREQEAKRRTRRAATDRRKRLRDAES